MYTPWYTLDGQDEELHHTEVPALLGGLLQMLLELLRRILAGQIALEKGEVLQTHPQHHSVEDQLLISR